MSLERKIANLSAATTVLNEALTASHLELAALDAAGPAGRFSMGIEAAMAAAAAATAVSISAVHARPKAATRLAEVLAVDSIADLLRLAPADLQDGMQVSVRAYRAGAQEGGGTLYWDADSTSADNGGTVFAIAGVATGRWKRLYAILEPQHFGATGLGVKDDTLALQAFATYFTAPTTPDTVARMFGTFRTSAKIVFDAAFQSRLTLYCGFVIHPMHTTDEEAVLFKAMPGFTQVGAMQVIGPGGTDWASHTIGKGFLIEDCGGASFDFIFVSHARWDAVTVREGSSMVTIKHVHAGYCGSNDATEALGYAVRFAARSDTGSSGNPGQLSVVRVSAMDAARIRAGQAYVVYAGEPYFVQETDTIKNTISLSPWLPLAEGNSRGEFRVIDGAALRIQGSDASQCAIGMLDSLGCGVGLFADALYPPVVQSLVTQSCGIGYAYSTIGNAALGGQVLTSYYEGNSFDIVKGSASDNAENVVGISTNLDFSKVVGMGRRFTAAPNLSVRTSLGRLAVWSAAHGQYLGVGKSPFIGETLYQSAGEAGLTKALHIDPYLTLCFDYRVRDFTVFGSGAKGQPIGTITLTVPPGYAINGGVDGVPVAFSGFPGPVRFLCYLSDSPRAGVPQEWRVTMIQL